MLKVSDFTIEYRHTVLGIDEPKPRLSWIIESDKNNTVQTAFSLIIKSEAGDVCWDSGKIISEQSVHIEYAGERLTAQTTYIVLLKIWDNYGVSAESSLQFETGLIDKYLKGDFISCSLPDENVSPSFFTEFSLNRKIKRARLYATALGVYEAFINGKRVGDFYDAPFWTSYSHRLQYQTYDITDLVLKENTIEIYAANGWYKGELGFTKQKNNYGDKIAVCADIYIQYEDGGEEYIVTDKSWKAKESAIRKSEFFDGEFIDTQFTADKTFSVEIINYDNSKIIGQINEPIRITERITAKEIIITAKNETVIDFGQNLTGIVEIIYKGKAGDKVTVKHAEVLDKEGNFYTANLTRAACTDTFVLNGETQILKPHFTYRGFRYIQLIGFENNPNKSDINALVLHSDMKSTGSFECSDKDVNRLWQNIVWGQRGNFFDVPTDCPQRSERLGWTGDAQVFCRTAAFNYNVAPFFAKWLGDLALEQTKEFGVPHVVPNIMGSQDACACWGDAATVIPWTIYKVYGDKRILEKQYESMKAWIEYIRSKSPDGLWQTGFQYGDWLALDKEESSDRTGATDKYLVATAFYAYSTEILRNTAKVLGLDADYKEYAELYKNIVSAFQKEYITATGRLVSETQTACVLTLHFNLAPDKFKDRIITTLQTNLNEHKNHLTTGFAGTPYLCQTLSDNGLHDIAGVLLLNKDYPSWLYQVKKGATTIWERWNGILPDGNFYDPGMNSFNHYAYGSIGDFLYRKIAGIDCIEQGYKKILIKPFLTKGLERVRAELDSVYGKIISAYECRNGKIKINIEIPSNTTAVIYLPEINQIKEVGSGKYEYEYKTALNLAVQRYSFESTLKSFFEDTEAAKLLKESIPQFSYNPMIEFAYGLTINELISYSGDGLKTIFETLINKLNKKETDK